MMTMMVWIASMGLAQADCEDDNWEDNDHLSDATEVSLGSVSGLVICENDPDWFVITATAGEVVQIKLEFAQDDGDIDLKLYDLDGSILAQSLSATDDENLNYYNESDGPLYIEVSFYNTNSTTTSNEYLLDISSAMPPECTADAMETNNTQFTAAELPDGSTTGLLVCEYDVDWFRFTLAEAEQISLVASYDIAEGDLDMALYNTLGENLVSSVSTDDDELLTYLPNIAGDYFLAVQLYADEGNIYGNHYSLNLTREQRPTCSDDANEENDDFETASAVGTGTHSDLNACDDDWYEITPEEGQLFSAVLTFDSEQGDLDLLLVDAAQQPLGSSSSPEEEEELEYEAMSTEPIYLQVKLFSDAGDIGVPYTLQLSLKDIQDTGGSADEPSSEEPSEPANEPSDSNSPQPDSTPEKGGCAHTGESFPLSPMFGFGMTIAFCLRRKTNTVPVE